MNKRILTRLLVLCLVAAGSIWLIASQGLRLGLDLRGGVQIELAGIVLTIGVGIDSNVLVFERIREELRSGRPVSSAVATGFQRVFRTLIDTHLAAMISAMILFMFGTGAMRGFAVTLAIGLLSNLFTSVFVSRTLFEWVLWRRRSLSI